MQDPKGGAHGCAPFPAEPWMASLEITRRDESIGLLRRGRAFLWLLSLALQRKLLAEGESFYLHLLRRSRRSTKAVARGTVLPSFPASITGRTEAFALSREFISFEGTKETEPKKMPSPREQTCWFTATGIFRLAIHGSIEKRRASMHAALRVLHGYRRFERCERREARGERQEPRVGNCMRGVGVLGNPVNG